VKDLPFFLTVQEVLDFHADQIQEFGGSEGLRDEDDLDSAASQATFDGEYLDPLCLMMFPDQPPLI